MTKVGTLKQLIGTMWDILWKDTIEVERRGQGSTYRYVLPPPVLHCVDKPAVEYPHGGSKCWFQHGVRHRVNGPAIDFGNPKEDLYFIKGKQMVKAEYDARDKSKDRFSKDDEAF